MSTSAPANDQARPQGTGSMQSTASSSKIDMGDMRSFVSGGGPKGWGAGDVDWFNRLSPSQKVMLAAVRQMSTGRCAAGAALQAHTRAM